MSPKSCFSCAVVLVFLGIFALVLGIVYAAIDMMHSMGIIFLSVGGGLILLGVPACRHSIRAMKEEKREFAAQQTSGPVVCGLLPGKPIAGNYLEQTQPLQQSERARNPGYSTQSGSHRPQSGYSTQCGFYRPQSSTNPSGSYQQLPAQGYQQLQHSPRAHRSAYSSGGLPPPSYSDVMYGPTAKFSTAE